MGKHSKMLVFKLRDLYHVPLGQRVVFPDNQIEVISVQAADLDLVFLGNGEKFLKIFLL